MMIMEMRVIIFEEEKYICLCCGETYPCIVKIGCIKFCEKCYLINFKHYNGKIDCESLGWKHWIKIHLKKQKEVYDVE